MSLTTVFQLLLVALVGYSSTRTARWLGTQQSRWWWAIDAAIFLAFLGGIAGAVLSAVFFWECP